MPIALTCSSSHYLAGAWAHNSHLGDARFTEMGERGELNLGQLVREKYGNDSVLVGFTTHHGTVTAASDWGEPAERKLVRNALPGSYELTLHDTGVSRILLIWRDAEELAARLRQPRRLERGIGVIYRPDTERLSHYFGARLPDQFDAVLHFNETHALEPLERTGLWEEGEVPRAFHSRRRRDRGLLVFIAPVVPTVEACGRGAF